MADTPKVYVICDQNCKFEGMTKEQILTAIMQAVNDGTISDIDTGFVTTIKTINGTALKFFVGEQNEYEALTEEEKKGLFAIISDDAAKENLGKTIEELKEATESNAQRISELGDRIKIVTGSYVGTESCGANNPNILTLDIVPSLVVISGYNCPPMIIPCTEGEIRDCSWCLADYHYYCNCQTQGGNTIKWYCYETMHANVGFTPEVDEHLCSIGQRNVQGNTYYYWAIGY